MNIRSKLVYVFEDTMKWIKENSELKSAVERSISKTKLYLEQDYPDVSQEENKFETTISVSREKTFEAARRLRKKYPDSQIAVHNFASATNPGGGVTRGYKAQEESLCRCSTLYPTLNTDYLWKNYYMFHRERHDALYTDACIFSPNILIIKDDSDDNNRLTSEEWCEVDVLTCAAPNLRSDPVNYMNPGTGSAVALTNDELLNLHKKRAEHILTIAAANSDEVLVLGAFGCGAFRNDPKIVAQAYKEVIEEFNGYFRHIEFAVYCREWEKTNFDTFKMIFG